MKMSVARWELIVLGATTLLFVVLLFPALQQARREARDGQRKAAVLAAKRELEDIYNRQELYPLVHDPAGDVSYTVTETDGRQALGWYVRIPLERSVDPRNDFDLEHNVYFRFAREGATAFYDICGGTDTCDAGQEQR